MMVVCTDGYILNADETYFADNDNTDATILRAMLIAPEDPKSILSVLQKDDALLLDRGFKKAIEDAESHGIKTFMPCFLKKPDKQFSTKDANYSRQVTILRGNVERANGRLKLMFKFFDHVVPARYMKNLPRLLQVALGIINAFSPPLFTETEFHVLVADKVVERLNMCNELMDKVLSTGLDRVRVKWELADEDCVLEFPELSIDDIREITLGPYQVRQASLYNYQHTGGGSSGYRFFVHKDVSGLIYIKLQSRHSKGNEYKVWIEFVEHGTGPESILGYYCLCKNGARTLGCCSHVAAVRYTLGILTSMLAVKCKLHDFALGNTVSSS
jgi:hypothetical protein